MAQSFSVHRAALLVSAAAAAFCFWAGNGTQHALCFTAGCRLFEDLSVAGISLYTVGVTGFGLLALLALTGRTSAGKALSTLAVVFDLFLLAAMIFTAPCINCLIIAVFVLATYLCFRNKSREQSYISRSSGNRDLLPVLWGLLFLINAAGVAREELSVWAITENADNAAISVYFSPSCSLCSQAVEKLSGRVDVAFFPVAENESDTVRVAAMSMALAQGASLPQALAASSRAEASSALDLLSPGMLLLRFRLLRNMAHVYAAGTDKIPFIEYHGLPSFLAAEAKAPSPAPAPTPKPKKPVIPLTTGTDPTLPIDTGVWGSCSAGRDCDEGEAFSRPVHRTKLQ